MFQVIEGVLPCDENENGQLVKMEVSVTYMGRVIFYLLSNLIIEKSGFQQLKYTSLKARIRESHSIFCEKRILDLRNFVFWIKNGKE